MITVVFDFEDCSTARVLLQSTTRYGRRDFGVNAERIRDYLMALRAVTASQSKCAACVPQPRLG